MPLTAKLASESWTIGVPPPEAAPSSPTSNTIFVEFGAKPSLPLTGGVPVSDFVDELSRQVPGLTELLAAARRENVAAFGASAGSFRALRLNAGLSQAALAERAGVRQPYIARIEAGSVDPGTKMIARLAAALGIDARTAFDAICQERE